MAPRWLNLVMLTAFGPWAFANGEPATERAERPNILLILTDDQGYGDAGFQGNPYLRTPRLDTLAESGVRFSHFLASPTCSPSRASLLTGRHEFRNGVTHTVEGRYLMRAGVPTLADALRGVGYRTAIFGKWHLGDTPGFHPLDRGFDHSLLIGGGAIGQTPDFWGNTMFDPHFEENRIWKPFSGYATTVLVEEALRWIDQSREPWFCYLALNAPHTPLQVGEEWFEHYIEMGLPERLARFYGMIENLDHEIGRLLDHLAAQGELERTVVIFLGDNGTALGGDPQPGEFNGGLRGTKASPYQGGIRVPAVFYYPGKWQAGVEVDRLAGLVDVFPTLAGLVGLPTDDLPSFDGRSLLPLLENAPGMVAWEDRFFHTHVARWPSGTPLEELPFREASIRNQRFSLVNGVELYDLQADPGERNDLAEIKPDVVEVLRTEHLAWWDSILPSLREPPTFILPANSHEPVLLTCMDWRPSQRTQEPLPRWLWQQSTLAAWSRGDRIDGVDGAVGGWLIDVEAAGRYSLTLRKLPPEAAPLDRFHAGFVSLADHDSVATRPFLAGATEVTKEMDLNAGLLWLEPLIFGQRASGLPQGAYYLQILSSYE